jgi:antitoxin HicB
MSHMTIIKKFNVVFTQEKSGGFTVTVPTLPGCVTYGKNLSEANKMAKDAIKAYLKSLAKHDEVIPSDEESYFRSVDVSFPIAYA